MRLRKLKEPALIGNVVQRVGHEQAIERAEGPGERREIADVRDDVDAAVAPGISARARRSRSMEWMTLLAGSSDASATVNVPSPAPRSAHDCGSAPVSD